MAAGSVVARKRNSKRKVKTGCETCRLVISTFQDCQFRRDASFGCLCSISNRIRKVKCDENKPACQRCVNTGRTCDGYQSPFRIFTSQAISRINTAGVRSEGGSNPTQPPFIEIAPRDIELLSRCFSSKTLFDVKLDCDEEARQLLQACMTDPLIQHAVSSLKILRADLETSGDAIVQETPSCLYGLEQYSMALGGLASNLSSSNPNALKSALLCCQVFISIEQLRKNYAAMGQHLIRGLRIMQEYRARPHFNGANKLVPAHHDQLPFLDVFIIKLFAAPCKFADLSETSARLISPRQQSVESLNLRTIAPNTRTRLTKIAALTLDFLDKVSKVESTEIAIQLLSEKRALLNSLEAWLIDLEFVQAAIGYTGPEPIPESFLRFFHLILKVVLLGALESSPDLDAELRIENDRLQCVANNVGERVKTYVTCSGTDIGQGSHSTGR